MPVKCLILAAGYGTRMQALTGDVPKALIPIGASTVLDLLLARVDELDVSSVLVTNRKYHQQFLDWRARSRRPITILDDGSETVEQRLGAVGDIQFALERIGFDEDLLIVAADNLLEFSLRPMADAFRAHGQGQLAVWHNPDLADQQRRGVVEVDGEGRVTRFTEKPRRPAGHLAVAPLYLLPAALLDEPARYLAAGGNPDAPGYLMAHLAKYYRLRTFHLPGPVIDVGNPESYARALRRHGGGELETNC